MKYFFSFLFLSVLIFSCGPTVRLSRENLSEQFSADGIAFSPEFTVYNFLNDSSKLYFKLSKKDLLFKNEEDSFVSRINVHYDLFPSYNSVSILDSATFQKKLFKDEDEYFIDSVNFKMKQGTDAVLKIRIQDVNRNSEVSRLIKIRKSGSIQNQDFLAVDENYVPLLKNNITPVDSFDIITRDTAISSFWVRCYFRKYPMAAPPFREGAQQSFSFRPDSLFRISTDSISSLRLERYGIYHFQPDSSIKEGITFYRFEHGFPEIKLADQLVDPTRYLTTNEEYKAIYTAKDKRGAIDKFWIEMGGSNERARSLIKTYYSRVQDANRHFTSYTEGWKTDRGMMYIIFGPPQTVYRDDQNEIWLYRMGYSMPDVNFTFRKIKNPFSENDYSLIREKEFESYWYTIVEQWRQGRVIIPD